MEGIPRTRWPMTETTSRFLLDVGDRLRRARRANRLSLADVSERSGGRWSPSTIGSYERMDRVPNLGVLTALARLYRVSPAWLVGDRQTSAARTTGLTVDRTALAALSTAAAAAVDGILA